MALRSMSWETQHARQFSNVALYNLNETLGDPYLQQQTKKEPLPRPYLGLGARVSQCWLNQWTILLSLVIIRLAIAASCLRSQMENGRGEAQAACSALEMSASTALSIPNYLGKGSNALVALSIDASVSALSAVIEGLLTATEALVLFFINTFKSTYICLLKLAIEGSIGAVLDATETIGNALNTTLIELGQDIQEGIADANTAVNKVAGFVEKASAFLGQKIDIPKVSIPLAKIEDFKIPSSFDQGLDKARAALNLDAVENATDAAIRYPFEQLKLLVDARFSNFFFNQSLLPVPSKESLSFCADADIDQTFSKIVDGVVATYHILLAVLIVAAFLVVIAYGGLAYWEWRSLNQNARRAAELSTESDADPIERLLIAEHPLRSSIVAKLTRSSKPRNTNLIRWWAAYVTHKPAAFVLLLAIAGLLSCGLQALMLRSLQNASPELAESAGQISQQVQALLEGKSEDWANATNLQISQLQSDLNTDLLGWVTTSTQSVNDTLNVFTDTLVGTLNSTFGGTILYDPILSVFNCLILVKVRGVESGLTWVHDKAQVTLPKVPTSALALQQEDGDPLLDEMSGQSVADGVTSVIDKIANLWRKSIRQEAATAGGLLAVWIFVALIGLLRCLLAGGDLARWFKSMPILGALRKSAIGQPHQQPSQGRRHFDDTQSVLTNVADGEKDINAYEKDDASMTSHQARNRSMSEVTDLDALYQDRQTAPIVERVGQVPKIHAFVGQVSAHHKSVVPMHSR
jgi:hypothetical protein